MRFLIFLFVSGFLISCSTEAPLDQKYDVVGNKDNSETSPTEIMEGRAATAVFYLSPECPLCRNYTVTIKHLQEQFKDQNIGFFGVVSGDFYSKSQVKSYLLKYDMDLDVLMDPDFLLAERYGAEITPEVHLLDREGRAVYRGAIDNWAISLGQKRQKVSEHYLADAINAQLAGKPIDPDKTEAVGCYIE